MTRSWHTYMHTCARAHAHTHTHTHVHIPFSCLLMVDQVLALVRKQAPSLWRVHMCECMYVIYIYIYTDTHIYIFVYVFASSLLTPIQVCMCVSIYVCMYVCMYVCKSWHGLVNRHPHYYVYVYMRVYVYAYMYMYYACMRSQQPFICWKG